ncbi:MAG: KAP family NTPase, partial [Verrucomicrobiae bacterium]|nr:KAP family NTPase [Verrucomicrobiae bacterium]
MSEKTFQLLGDGPYLEGDDPLEFHVLAEGIVGLLNQAHGSTPLTLGIQASWGMGKSSLMHQLKRKLDESPDTFKTVWFNAWTFDGEDILEGLIKTALEQMDPNILRRALRNEKFVNISKAITSIASRWIGINRLIDDLWEAVKVDPRARNQLRDLLNEAMEKWLHKNAKDQAKKKMIVIFIDDLDRCSPESVFSVFEAIKLYLDAKGFVFVIGVDSDIVSEAVLEHKKYSKRVTSEQYVE